MTTLSLRLATEVVSFDAGGGEPVRLPLTRIVCPLLVKGGRVLVDGWIDTGATLTVFPLSAWDRFRDQVGWLGGTAANGIRVAGETCRYRIGRVAVAATTADLKVTLPAVPVTAACLQDPGRLKYALIGLTRRRPGRPPAGRRTGPRLRPAGGRLTITRRPVPSPCWPRPRTPPPARTAWPAGP
jgi:hypothetical protein